MKHLILLEIETEMPHDKEGIKDLVLEMIETPLCRKEIGTETIIKIIKVEETK